MPINDSVAIIAFCFLFFTVVFVITLIFLIRLAVSVKRAMDNTNQLIIKAQANVDKVGGMIDDVKDAVRSIKSAVDTFRNPFTALITFLTGLMGMFFKSNEKAAAERPAKRPAGKKGRK